MKKIINNNTLCVCILCFVIALLIYGPIIINQHGFYTAIGDYDVQQIPFTYSSHKQIVEHGIDSWMWNLDLGTSFVQGMGFYTLGTPFFWLTMLFPVVCTPYLMGFIFIIKYILAGLFSYLFFKNHVNDKKWAVIGALLYAFSGYQAVNIGFYHFHDVVAFFPLLLISLEKMMESEDKKYGLFFALAVFLNCITNFFFFVQEVVFLVIYFLFRYWEKDIKVMINRILRCVIFGLLGICMASVLFLPGILFIMKGTRNSTSFYLENIIVDAKTLFLLLKGILLPADVMWNNSAVRTTDFASTSCYIPLFGVLMGFVYMVRKNDWLKKLLVFLSVLTFVPAVNAVFLMFAESNQRWWFMLVAIFILATIKVLDEYKGDSSLLKSSIIYLGVVIAFGGLLLVGKWSKEVDSVMYSPKKFMVFWFIAVMGAMITAFLSFTKKYTYSVVLVLTVAFAFVSSEYTFLLDKVEEKAYRDERIEQYEVGRQVKSIDDQYRYNSANNNYMIPSEAGGTSAFCTTTSNPAAKFDSFFEYSSPNTRMNKSKIEGLTELLAGKYVISEEQSGKVVDTIKVNGKSFFVIETEACPIGYAVDSYFIEDEIYDIEKEQRGKAFLSAAMINAEDESKVSSLLNRVNVADVANSTEIADAVSINSLNKVNEFVRTDKGFKCVSNFDSKRAIYFSVPFENGWKAYIDGKEAEIIESGAMMLLVVEPGKHNIEFIFSAPGFKAGLLISICSILVVIGCLIIIYIKRNRNVAN